MGKVEGGRWVTIVIGYGVEDWVDVRITVRAGERASTASSFNPARRCGSRSRTCRRSIHVSDVPND